VVTGLSGTWFTLDAAQEAMALRAAHQIAASSIPTASGDPARPLDTQIGWPANVSLVSYAGSTRVAARAFLDGNIGTSDGVVDDRPVIVVRLVGRFPFITTVRNPVGGAATCIVSVALLDASDGSSLGGGVGGEDALAPLPNATIAYQRERD
jgi:hypothetical protein